MADYINYYTIWQSDCKQSWFDFQSIL